MTERETGQWINGLIAAGRIHDFYTSPEWEHLRREVLEEAKYECQWCKRRGLYTRADTVHHIQFVRRHPELALSRAYRFGGKEYANLVPLCRACHELAHGGRGKPRPVPLTPERW